MVRFDPSNLICKFVLVHLSAMLLLLFLTVFTVSGFNIEDRYPIVKAGPKDSLFGLSVAQHFISESTAEADNARLLVGAPTALSVSDGARSGALYSCPVFSNDNCTIVSITSKRSKLFENSSTQWLGVSVKSEKPGGKIVTCAHRFTLIGPDWEAPLGRCFMLENEGGQGSDVSTTEFVPCEPKVDDKGFYSHEGYGHCQAGTSVNFVDPPLEDDAGAYLWIGAPGSLFWSGSAYATRISGSFGWVVEQLWAPEDPNRKNFQMGDAVSGGRLYRDNVTNFITGAPAANMTGAVYILEKADENEVGFLNIVEIIEGDKVASRFGHDVLLSDVNGDGRLDLIVGAPLFYDRTDQVGGAVYVYVNKGLSTIGPSPSQKLFGKIDSYFGMAIANAGDVNLDGADDIVIGAPGENEWSGAVYIYHGDNSAESIGVHPNPSQVIEASKLSTPGKNLFGLGYSISSGLDMDFNGYPDVAVGSLSDTAMIFLARPVVNVSGTISGPGKKIELSEGPSEQVLDVTACLKYNALPSSFDEKVQVVGYVLLDSARVERGLLSRLSFEGSSSKENVAKKTFSMTLFPQSRSKPKCITWQTYMKNDVRDKLSPIELKLSFTTANNLKKRKRRQATHPTPIPIMNSVISNTSVAAIEFAKRCGDDEICRTNLEKTAYYQVLKNGNWSDLQDREGQPLLVLGTEEQIGLVIEVTNKLPGEDAHQARLEIVLPEELSYRKIELLFGNAIHCDPDTTNQSLVICHLGNPFEEESDVKFILRMSKTRSMQKATEFAVRLQLLTTSQHVSGDPDPGTVYPVFVEVEAQLVIDGYPSKEQVNFAGNIIGESAVFSPSDAGTIHTHRYEVVNSGTGVVEDVQLKIKWPQSISNGKWLFYLLNAHVDGFGNCSLPDDVNPLNLRYKTGRSKRDVNDPPGNYKDSKAALTEYVHLSCSKEGGLLCIDVICVLGDLAPKVTASVDMTAILWNSTFLEEYHNVSGVYVDSFAKVFNVQENIKFSKLSRLNMSVITTVLPEDAFLPAQPIEWWIIAVAGAAGLILLVFLVLIMWKCGFFKRQTLVDYQKARKHKQASKKVEEKEVLY